jgi:CRISPR system Cascade subunit CasE
MSTLYLSRLMANTRGREVQRDLADCHNMHRRILMGFPDDPNTYAAREQYGVLYRVEQSSDGGVQILVQSRHAPDWSRLPEQYLTRSAEVKRVDEAYARLRPGMELVFRLRGNPTRRISEHNTVQGEKWRGKRVDLRREEDQLAWLRRKGEQSGFSLVDVRLRPGVSDVRTAPGVTVHGLQRGGVRLTFGSALFEGRLRVTDLDRLRQVIEGGIGSGKAFGFGLLSVAPAASAGLE